MTRVACRLWFPILKPSCVFVFSGPVSTWRNIFIALGEAEKRSFWRQQTAKWCWENQFLKNNELIHSLAKRGNWPENEKISKNIKLMDEISASRSMDIVAPFWELVFPEFWFQPVGVSVLQLQHPLATWPPGLGLSPWRRDWVAGGAPGNRTGIWTKIGSADPRKHGGKNSKIQGVY